MNRLAVLVIASLVACLAALPAVAQAAKKTQVLYGANGSGGGSQNPAPGPTHLLELNHKNGEVKRKIGKTGFAVTGLALHPKTKVLYGVTGAQDQTAPRLADQGQQGDGQGKADRRRAGGDPERCRRHHLHQ